MSQRHKITWFKRDHGDKWQWQGFEEALQTDDDVTNWFDGLIKQYGDDAPESPEIFVLDLEHLDELSGAYEPGEAEIELQLLRGWLEEVVDIDSITVEEEFDEYRARKISEAQEVNE
jgi:hypothetical protein